LKNLQGTVTFGPKKELKLISVWLSKNYKKFNN